VAAGGAATVGDGVGVAGDVVAATDGGDVAAGGGGVAVHSRRMAPAVVITASAATLRLTNVNWRRVLTGWIPPHKAAAIGCFAARVHVPPALPATAVRCATCSCRYQRTLMYPTALSAGNEGEHVGGVDDSGCASTRSSHRCEHHGRDRDPASRALPVPTTGPTCKQHASHQMSKHH